MENRVKEIRDLIGNNDINRASLRLIDFVNDFSPNNRIKNDIILLRMNYTKVRDDERKFGFSDDQRRYRNILADQILKTLDILIEEELKVATESANEDLLPSIKDSEVNTAGTFFEETKDIFEKDIIFKGTSIGKSYKNYFLRPIDLVLKAGEVTGIVGENGSGKSTLIRIIARDIYPDYGIVAYPAITSDINNHYFLRSQIGYIPQNLFNYKLLSVRDELLYTFAKHGIIGKKNQLLVDEVIYRLRLEEYQNHFWRELSGGYKLRVELAKVIGLKRRLIVLDEPLANLDINTQQIFLNDIKDFVSSPRYQSTVIISSQHLYEVESIADNLIFLQKGRVGFQGRKEELDEEKTENIYEIFSKTSFDNLSDVFRDFDRRISLSKWGLNFIVKTPLDVKKNHLLNFFTEKNIDLSYFRDISSSTRKFFRNDETF